MICNDDTGRCDLCQTGFYKDQSSGSCLPCKAGCVDCYEYGTCLECDSKMHQLVRPWDNICQCDRFRGWIEKKERSWECDCHSDYLTDAGLCMSCDQAFPGCSNCIKVGNLGDQIALGVSVVSNAIKSSTDPGIYKCNKCGSDGQFFDHEFSKCSSCESRLNGC